MEEKTSEERNLKALEAAKNLMIREFRYLDAFKYFEKYIHIRQLNEGMNKSLLIYINSELNTLIKLALQILNTENVKTILKLFKLIISFLLKLQCKEISKLLSLAYLNTSRIYEMISKSRKCLKNLKLSLKVNRSFGNNEGNPFILINISSIYSSRSKHSTAIIYAKKAIAEANELISQISKQCYENENESKQTQLNDYYNLLAIAYYNIGVENEIINPQSSLKYYIKAYVAENKSESHDIKLKTTIVKKLSPKVDLSKISSLLYFPNADYKIQNEEKTNYETELLSGKEYERVLKSGRDHKSRSSLELNKSESLNTLNLNTIKRNQLNYKAKHKIKLNMGKKAFNFTILKDLNQTNVPIKGQKMLVSTTRKKKRKVESNSINNRNSLLMKYLEEKYTNNLSSKNSEPFPLSNKSPISLNGLIWKEIQNLTNQYNPEQNYSTSQKINILNKHRHQNNIFQGNPLESGHTKNDKNKRLLILNQKNNSFKYKTLISGNNNIGIKIPTKKKLRHSKNSYSSTNLIANSSIEMNNNSDNQSGKISQNETIQKGKQKESKNLVEQTLNEINLIVKNHQNNRKSNDEYNGGTPINLNLIGKPWQRSLLSNRINILPINELKISKSNVPLLFTSIKQQSILQNKNKEVNQRYPLIVETDYKSKNHSKKSIQSIDIISLLNSNSGNISLNQNQNQNQNYITKFSQINVFESIKIIQCFLKNKLLNLNINHNLHRISNKKNCIFKGSFREVSQKSDSLNLLYIYLIFDKNFITFLHCIVKIIGQFTKQTFEVKLNPPIYFGEKETSSLTRLWKTAFMKSQNNLNNCINAFKEILIDRNQNNLNNSNNLNNFKEPFEFEKENFDNTILPRNIKEFPHDFSRIIAENEIEDFEDSYVQIGRMKPELNSLDSSNPLEGCEAKFGKDFCNNFNPIGEILHSSLKNNGKEPEINSFKELYNNEVQNNETFKALTINSNEFEPIYNLNSNFVINLDKNINLVDNVIKIQKNYKEYKYRKKEKTFHIFGKSKENILKYSYKYNSDKGNEHNININWIIFRYVESFPTYEIRVINPFTKKTIAQNSHVPFQSYELIRSSLKNLTINGIAQP